MVLARVTYSPYIQADLSSQNVGGKPQARLLVSLEAVAPYLTLRAPK